MKQIKATIESCELFNQRERKSKYFFSPSLIVSFLVSNILVLVFFSFQISAQSVANYSVTRTTGVTYNSIATTGIAIPAWRNSSSNLTDDNRSYAINLGFEFFYLGIRYTQVSVSTNGFVDLSSSTADGNSVNPYRENPQYLSMSGGTLLALAPLHEDLWTGNGGSTTLSNSIKYQLSGTVPNRVFTIEYIGMDNFTAPNDASLNFQVKLYESSGIIEFVYGTMTAGSSAHSYGCGINAGAVSGTPAVSELLEQQVANTATFSNSPKYNLSAVPASYSKIIYTPPTPLAPTSLSFTAITKTSTTLNWIDNANNELKYLIYNSTDGINYSFVTSIAANSTNTNITGLTAGTNYFWNVYAVSEGKLTSPLTGTQATSAGGTYISNVVSGNWNTASSWTGPGGVPGLGDNVIIQNGHTIIVNLNAQCNNLTIGQGTSGIVLIGNNTSARTLTIQGDITILNGGTLKANSSYTATHLMNLSGNIINNGTLDFNSTANSICNVTFIKNGNQSISGTGTMTRFNKMTLNMGSSFNNILDITSSNFTATTDFLTLTNGSLQLSTASTITPFTTNDIIPLNAGIIINHSGATINTTGGSITLFGLLSMNLGTINIGNAADNNLSSNGGTYIQSGGTITIAGRFDRIAANDLTYFTMSGGTMIVAAIGSTTVSMAPFHLTEDGSVFNMSNGNIILHKPGAGNLGYLNTISNGFVTGGTLQIGDASTPIGQVAQINTTMPVYNLKINSPNVTGRLISNSLTVLNNINISNGILDANTLNISVGGNWDNASSLADPFLQSTGRVTFNGNNAQTISAASAQESFYNLVIANTNGDITLLNSTDLDISNSLTLSNGVINTGNDLVVLRNSSASSLIYTNGYINGNFRRYIASNTSTYIFPVGSGNSLLNRHTLSFINNILNGVSFIDAQVVNFSQSNPNFDANLSTMQQSSPVTGTVGETTGQTIIWTLSPNSAPTGGSFGLNLSVENTNLTSTDDNAFIILQRNLTNSYIHFKTNESTTSIPATSLSGRIYNSGNGYAQRLGYTSFGQFAIGRAPAPLPVQLLSFDAKLNGDIVNIDWITSSEINNNYFTIERSSNGIEYEEVGKIQGSGNSTIEKYYNTIDVNPLEGTSYYRLRQTDYNGFTETFQPVSVTRTNILKNSIKVCVTPTLFSESFTAKFELPENKQLQIQIINMTGAMVYSESTSAEKGNYSFLFNNNSNLNAGTYILRIISNSEILALSKIICNK